MSRDNGQLLVLLLMSDVCAPGSEDSGLLWTWNDGSSSSPAQCTTRPARSIFAASCAAQRSAAVIAACARCAFTGVVSLLLLLLKVGWETIEVGVWAVTRGVGRRARMPIGASSLGDSLHFWNGHRGCEGGRLAVIGGSAAVESP